MKDDIFRSLLIQVVTKKKENAKGIT